MLEIYNVNTFNDFLSESFEQRRAKNARYSLRSFARDLGLSPSRLSEILRGESISVSSAESICERLSLKATQKTFLLDLIRSQSGRSERTRDEAAKRLATVRERRDFHQVSGEIALSKWYFLHLIEYLTATNLTEPQIADVFEIGLDELRESISTLSQHGFIDWDEASSTWIKPDQFLKFESTSPSKLIRDYHRHLLQKAHTAIESQPINRRKFLSFAVSIDDQRIQEARQELEAFCAAFSKKYSDIETEAVSVYTLAMQFYDLKK